MCKIDNGIRVCIRESPIHHKNFPFMTEPKECFLFKISIDMYQWGQECLPGPTLEIFIWVHIPRAVRRIYWKKSSSTCQIISNNKEMSNCQNICKLKQFILNIFSTDLRSNFSSYFPLEAALQIWNGKINCVYVFEVSMLWISFTTKMVNVINTTIRAFLSCFIQNLVLFKPSLLNIYACLNWHSRIIETKNWDVCRKNTSFKIFLLS